MTKITRVFLVALATLVLPSTLFAQQPPAPALQNQQQLETWFVELQQIGVQLGQIQAKALEDPALQAAQESLGTEVKTAMDRVDPGLSASVDRVAALEQEAVQAQQAGDHAKIEQLARELQQIQVRFITAQNQALQEPALAAKVEAFQTRLERRMIEIDPQSRQLIDRLRELEGKLQAASQGQ